VVKTYNEGTGASLEGTVAKKKRVRK